MVKILAKNRVAKFNYEAKDAFLAGIVLLGIETKSVRIGEIDLKGAFVTFMDGEVCLTNAHIKAYKFAGEHKDYDPNRTRKLLLNKSEINKLIAAKQSGFTIIPLSVELHGKYIKLRIATARGKKLHDKRQSIKKRDIDRDTSRDLKRIDMTKGRK